MCRSSGHDARTNEVISETRCALSARCQEPTVHSNRCPLSVHVDRTAAMATRRTGETDVGSGTCLDDVVEQMSAQFLNVVSRVSSVVHNLQKKHNCEQASGGAITHIRLEL